MAPSLEKTIHHFTHPAHSLQHVSSNNEYKCDGCKTDGFGKRYRCDLCNFDLHEHCATYPAVLASFIHPGHHLNLVMRKAQSARHKLRVCDFCGDQVEGLFYRCEGCNFDVHPLCTQLPQSVRHALHPHHPLVLQPSVGNCLVCKNACNSMGYGCSICRVDIHIECIILAAPASHTTSAETSQRLVRPLRPASAFQEPQSQSHMHVPPQHGAHDTYDHHPGHYNAHQSQGGEVSHVGRRRRVMFYLVRKLGIGSLTGTVFGASSITYT